MAGRQGEGPGGTGYRSAEFASAHAHEGPPIELPSSGSWLVRRAVPSASGVTDATACYPLLTCGDWDALPSDLDGLDDLVSVTAVIDPLADGVDHSVLEEAFPDLLRPYKQHLVVDLSSYGTAPLGSHHRRNVNRGHRQCVVEEVMAPVGVADEWIELYAQLKARHGVTGRADLPDAALRAQLAVPGVRLWRADTQQGLAGMLVWMVSDRAAYYHLGAYSPSGYDERAAYALFDVALRDLAADADLAVLGSGAGDDAADEDDGLMRFKRGWGAFERTAQLAGRIVDRSAYERLARDNAPGFFPAYRAPGSRPAGSGGDT